MKEGHIKLINFLRTKRQNVTSEILSKELDISIRTVKYYVKEINEYLGYKLIVSSRNGYQIDQQLLIKYFQMEEHSFDLIPQNNYERAVFIIQQFIKSGGKKIDVEEICEQMYVSNSTLYKVIEELNYLHLNHKVKFERREGYIHIIGKEKDIRRIFMKVINQSSKNSFLDLETFQDFFPEINLFVLKDLINKLFKKTNGRINDFIEFNILIHIAILINRVKNANTLKDERIESTPINSNVNNEFLIEIEKEYNVKLSLIEVSELNRLLNYYELEGKSIHQIDSKYVFLVKKYIKNIYERYYIDLVEESFLMPFAFHLESLYWRASNNILQHNPLTEIVKKNNPLVFDIAIFIGLDFMKEMNVVINEDEIAFIAIHLGVAIEQLFKKTEKIKIGVYSPNYISINSYLIMKLESYFNNQVDFFEMSPQDLIVRKDIDLICSTISLENEKLEIPFIQISPLVSDRDLIIVENSINNVSLNYSDKKLNYMIDHFFKKDFFKIIEREHSQQEILNNLCNELYENNIVSQNFVNNVFQRELMASTAFGRYAIPHSVTFDAKISCINVLISRKGIEWGNSFVNIVFLIAINEQEIKLVREFYDFIFTILEKPQVLENVINSENYSEFISIIKSNNMNIF